MKRDKDGNYVEITWQEAITTVAQKLAKTPGE